MGWSSGSSAARRRLALLARLTGDERRALATAVVWLPVVDVALRTLPWSRARALAGLRVRRVPAGTSACDPVRAERLARVVAGAARVHPWPASCLRRALVLERILVSRGLEARLEIGVRRERGEELGAHAWVEHAGRALGEPERIEDRFAALALPARGGEREPGASRGAKKGRSESRVDG